MFLARADGLNSPTYPYLMGTRLTLRPFSNLEIGFQRSAQWAGGGRDDSLSSFVNMYLSRDTNGSTASAQARDPANEMAGYDVRLGCPSGVRCAVYGQAIGEDEAGYLPTKFLEMLGVEGWTADGNHRLFLEFARTGCHQGLFGAQIEVDGCAYRNYAYTTGYTSGGRWLGDSLGPEAQVFTLGWLDSDLGSLVKLHAGHVHTRFGTYAPAVDDALYSGRLLGLSARRTFAWGGAQWTPEFDWTHVHTAEGPRDDTRVGLEMSVALDDFTRGVPSRLGTALSASRSDPATQALVGLGLIGGAALLDHTADDFALNHQHDTTSLVLRHVGSVLPLVEFGVAGLAWIGRNGQPAGDLGLTSMEAGLSAVAAAEVVKLAVDRSRPVDGHGASDFGRGKRADSSFPSVHSALAWALLTPVAERYDAPWLYGVAALTNAGRVLGRNHWLSDTVAGAAMGYAIGDFFGHRGAGGASASQAQLIVAPRVVGLAVPFR